MMKRGISILEGLRLIILLGLRDDINSIKSMALPTISARFQCSQECDMISCTYW